MGKQLYHDRPESALQKVKVFFETNDVSAETLSRAFRDHDMKNTGTGAHGFYPMSFWEWVAKRAACCVVGYNVFTSHIFMRQETPYEQDLYSICWFVDLIFTAMFAINVITVTLAIYALNVYSKSIDFYAEFLEPGLLIMMVVQAAW